MRPTVLHLIAGFVLGTAVATSLALPGKLVIADQPPMQRLMPARQPAPLVVEAAPLPRARQHPTQPAAPPASAPRPRTIAAHAPRRPAPRRPVRPPRPAEPRPVVEQSVSTLGLSSSEPEKAKKDKKPKKEKRSKPNARDDGNGKKDKGKKDKAAKDDSHGKKEKRDRKPEKPDDKGKGHDHGHASDD